MKVKEIMIKYHPDGSVELEADGFVGGECLQATAPFEKVLGFNKNPKRKIKREGGDSGAVRTANQIQK